MRACQQSRTADEFAQYVTDTWGERAYDDDYVNARCSTATIRRAQTIESRIIAIGTTHRTVTHRRLLCRLKAFVRTEHGMRRLQR